MPLRVHPPVVGLSLVLVLLLAGCAAQPGADAPAAGGALTIAQRDSFATFDPAFAWSPEHELFVVASPASATIGIRRLARSMAVGAAAIVDLVYVDDELEPRPARWRVGRIGTHGWHLQDVAGTEERRFTVADDGRPILLDEASWPLET